MFNAMECASKLPPRQTPPLVLPGGDVRRSAGIHLCHQDLPVALGGWLGLEEWPGLKNPGGLRHAYFVAHVALMRFLDSGVIPIDNGVVERLHVRTALTRKNLLFAGSDAGAERAAVAYTLLGCCALAEVDPVEYLADVLPRLTTRRVRICDMPALLPAQWKAAREASVQPLAAVLA